jgi:hypothetical protein
MEYAPCSRPPTRIPKPTAFSYYSSAVIFGGLFLWTCIPLVFIQCLAVPLLVAHYPMLWLNPMDRKRAGKWFYQQYKSVIRFTEKGFGVCLLCVSSLLIPKTKLILTGDWESLKGQQNVILIANHQIYPDWTYIWFFARIFERHGDLQIMLIKELKYIPIFGWGMMFFGFIFMDRNLKRDLKTIMNAMKHHKEYCRGFPHWLLLYPEGTLNVPQNRETSNKYLQKMGLPYRPEVKLN